MMAEAVVRGGTEATLANVLPYINELQERAFGDNTHNKSESEINELFIINERARELYWEVSPHGLDPLQSIYNQQLCMAMERWRKRR